MRNIRLTLAYDGTNYVGWQVQPNGTPVQAVVEDAIEQLTGETVSLLAAGRTDSGVHALGQVANFWTESTIPAPHFRPGLQNFLPADVVVRDAAEVYADFHATYSARWKRYRYVIQNGRVQSPFLRNYALHRRGELNSRAMHGAAQALVGTHDFRSFESQFPNKATSVRTVLDVSVGRCAAWPIWTRQVPQGQTPTSGGEFICLDIRADGFLYNMVRAIAGTLLNVGRGRWTTDDVRRILESQDRAQAGDTAPAHGLYLVEVGYDD